MPLAAFTMAGLLFVYSRTSIRLAKQNAQLHREADGGQISWRNQALRQHGQKEEAVSGLAMDGMKVVYEKKDTEGGTGNDSNASEKSLNLVDLARDKTARK